MSIDERLKQLTENEIRSYKQNAVEIPYKNSSLFEVVFHLERLRSEGNLYYYIDFNGIKLYSIDTTLVNAFKTVYDCSFKEYLKQEYEEKIITSIEEKRRGSL